MLDLSDEKTILNRGNHSLSANKLYNNYSRMSLRLNA